MKMCCIEFTKSHSFRGVKGGDSPLSLGSLGTWYVWVFLTPNTSMTLLDVNTPQLSFSGFIGISIGSPICMSLSISNSVCGINRKSLKIQKSESLLNIAYAFSRWKNAFARRKSASPPRLCIISHPQFRNVSNICTSKQTGRIVTVSCKSSMLFTLLHTSTIWSSFSTSLLCRDIFVSIFCRKASVEHPGDGSTKKTNFIFKYFKFSTSFLRYACKEAYSPPRMRRYGLFRNLLSPAQNFSISNCWKQ